MLIVDDEPAVRDITSRWAASLGLRFDTATNADEALAVLRAHQYDLAFIDVMMPGRDGLWLAGELRREHPQTAVVLATAYSELLEREPAHPGCADLLFKPFQRDRFELAVDRGRQWRKQVIGERRWHAQLSLEVNDRIAAVMAGLAAPGTRALSDAETLLRVAVEETPQTAAHAERVARYAVSTALALGVDHEALALVEVAARFHDIGKIAIPTALLTKPCPLTPGERAIMQRHAEIGADILAATDTLASAAPAVRASHESFGGIGYPDGLEGDAIPFASRIIAVADAYDAMTQRRTYRRHVGAAEAIRELLRCSPSQFDPSVVDAFVMMVGTH